MKSWLDIPHDSDFSIYNIPFGIFQRTEHKTEACVGTRLGNHVVDLNILYKNNFFSDINLTENYFEKNTLNPLLSLGNQICEKIRLRIQQLFLNDCNELKSNSALVEKILIPENKTKNLLPIHVRDYVDFYSSKSHAINVGKMFRDEKNPLLPNWCHIPIGYHGRGSSILVSGTNFSRPKGQLKKNEVDPPIFAASEQMDFELEVAFITNKISPIGKQVTTTAARDHIFGLTLFNDWSARDIQRWEYVPLGPFLGKSFASSMSPWVVSLEALKPFLTEGESKDVPELDYLKCTNLGHYDIVLEVYLKTEKMQTETLICKSNYKYLYWNLYQQLAHMASNGSPINVGDVYASGTISGTNPDSFGSMLELAWKGTKPIQLANGESRKFLQDGDTITFKGYAEKDGMRVGFGQVTSTILPAI